MTDSLETSGLLFLGVMDLQEAKTHQIRLRDQNAQLILKTNPSTCTSGCKVTVEVWADLAYKSILESYFKQNYLNNLKGHMPDLQTLNEVFDQSKENVICQACGTQFSSKLNTCPDCGLVYF